MSPSLNIIEGVLAGKYSLIGLVLELIQNLKYFFNITD